MVAIYCITPAGSKLHFYSTVYCNPFFHQSWSLFVPPPKENYHLYVTLNNGQTFDLFQDLVHRHRQNRLGGNTPLLVSFINAIHYFENNTPRQAAENGPINNDQNFLILQHQVLKYCAGNNMAITGRFTLLVESDSAGRIYFN